MRKILFLINPVSGNKSAASFIKKIKDYFKDKPSIEISIVISTYSGEIFEIIPKYQQKGFSEFIAVGGDGTLNELLNALNLDDFPVPTIGIFPYGTGNDFAKTLGYSDEEKLLIAIERNETTLSDIGKANGKYFINTCSFGVDSLMDKYLKRVKNIIPGKFSYMFSGLLAGLNFKSSKCKITIDEHEIDTELTLLAITNGKYFGGGMLIAPEASTSDGKFEICIVHKIGSLKFLKEFPKVYSGNLHKTKEVTYHKGMNVTIESETAFPINIDGDFFGSTPANIVIIPSAIKVYKI